MKYCITINTRKDNLVIKISEDAEHSEIIEELNRKLPKLKKLYQDDNTPILVTGKVLKNKEIDEIQKIIKENIDVELVFDSPRSLGLHGIVKAYKSEIATSETKFHKGSLRSGRKIEYEGSIVVIGDVNDGAELIAGENIIVLGTIRGLAHAGAKGNRNAVIAAVDIESPQLRIADVIKEREKEDILENNVEYAFLNENGEMIFE